MNVLNAWLPPPVAEKTHLETQAFSEAVRLLEQDCTPSQLLASPYGSLRWISVINNFLKSKSYLQVEDIEVLISSILNLFLHGNDNYYVQARWGATLFKYLKKFSKKVSITLHWKPFYDAYVRFAFSRRCSFEGIGLQAAFVKSFYDIVRKCRRFFPKGSAEEIWAHFRPMLDDLSHNSSLEAVGFISLLLPITSKGDSSLFTSDWFAECLQLWDGVPYCQYWNSQWLSLIARCIRNSNSMPNLHVEKFVPELFSHFLRSFEVPVGKTSGVFPYKRELNQKIVRAFPSEWSHAIPRNIAKSVVHLLKPNGSAENHLACMVNLLEQYYHPSNGGPWTSSLERFLRHSVNFFIKRLAMENRQCSDKANDCNGRAHFLTKEENNKFVAIIAIIIERGQYSKSSSLANTAAKASSALAYIEPSLILPLSIKCFQTALNSVTAIHQLESAIKTLALSARTLVIGAAMNIELPNSDSPNEIVSDCKSTLELAMFHMLSGLDANDPPKTMATFQFFCSIFSSMDIIQSATEDWSSILAIDWSQWLDEFLGRLFSLLLHLDSDNHLIAAVESDKSLFGKSFLVQEDSFYLSTLELLFSRLNVDLLKQALKTVSKFVNTHTLKGAVAEIGLLCSAAVYANPLHGISDLMKPIMLSVEASLDECPSSGFSGFSNSHDVFDLKTMISPAAETSIVYRLNVISFGLMYGGEHVIGCKELVQRIIMASLDAPSTKVNEGGGHVISAILRSLCLYYPLDQYRIHKTCTGFKGVEEWLTIKADNGLDMQGPKWHLPSQTEITFANELLDMHLKAALMELKSICLRGADNSSGTVTKEKEHLRVVLLRIEASLEGVQSCLPDFTSQLESGAKDVEPHFLSGAIGASVGSVDLRKEAAEVLHLACNYCLKMWTDDIIILSLLARSITAVGLSGSLEYAEWCAAKDFSETELKALSEPPTNFLTGHFAKARRRPKWLVIELVILHNTWRASQAHYSRYRAAHHGNINPSKATLLLVEDLLSLSLHNYDAVRKIATSSLKSVLKRFPMTVSESFQVLLKSLKDPLAPEHAALGSCSVLASRAISRYVTEDFGALSDLFHGILSSGHHESVKAQNAIGELFGHFILRFGGLPVHHIPNESGDGRSVVYKDIIEEIQGFCSSRDFTHWRYNLMAQGMLLLLSAHRVNPTCCQGGYDTNIQNIIIGHFLLNLKSDFPLVRPLSIGSLLFLLRPPCKNEKLIVNFEDASMSEKSVTSSKSCLASIVSQNDFGKSVFKNLSIDHNFLEGELRSRQGYMGRMVSLFSENTIAKLWVPGTGRTWPRTRTLDPVMKGDGFSPTHAKLFERLIQECGSESMEAFCNPLQQAASDLDERGTQCSAAEAIAGFLHSDAECVVKAWDEWLQPLFRKLAIGCSVETLSEWTACVRFAATGKGDLGRRSPLTRLQVLRCLLEPLPVTSSSNVIVKYFTFACAALSEVSPVEGSSDELTHNQQFLSEALKFMHHPAPQVREVVGLSICIAGANLELRRHSRQEAEVKNLTSELARSEDQIDWKVHIVSQTLVESAKCQSIPVQGNESCLPKEDILPDPSIGHNTEKTDDLQYAVRFTETALYFLIAAMKSGYSEVLMDVVVELLQPVLSLQETSHKDLSALAKVALQFLKFQVFPATHVSKAESALLATANDSNWHTRTACLSFLQSFMYRHTFLLPVESLSNIWNEVKRLLFDSQIEVKELAAVTLTGMMKGSEDLFRVFYQGQLDAAVEYLSHINLRRGRKEVLTKTTTDVHAVVLGLSACVLSVPYDMPRWLPKVVTTLARFSKEKSPAVRETVRKSLSEFRRTHADTWAVQKFMFNEEELELLTDTSSSASYFA